MGLLDQLFNLTPEQNRGLAAAGAKMLELSGPSRTPRSFGQIAGAAYGTFNDTMDEQQQRAALQRQQAMTEQILGWKAKDAEADYGAQQGARAREDRIQKRLAALTRNGMPPGMAASIVQGGMGEQQPGAQGEPGMMPSQGQQDMPDVGSQEWMQGIQRQAGMASGSLARPGPGAGAGPIGGQPAPAPGQPDWFAMGMPPQMALSMQQGKKVNRTQQMVDNMMTKAQIQFEEGDSAGLEKTLDQIQKFRPNAIWKEVRQGGKVVNMPFFDDGLPGEASDAEVAAKLHWQDTGPSTFGLDAYDGSIKARLQNGLSPSAAASNAVARDSLALSRDRFAFDRQQAGRPVFNESMGGYMTPPSPQNPAGTFTPSPGRRNPKMTEDQGKATGWVVQAEKAWKNMQAVAYDQDGKLTNAAKPGFGDAVAALPFGIGESSGNHFRSANRQKFIQGASSLSESLLRAATGAGVNRDEAIQKTREITPVWGDTEEVIAQKMEGIPLYLDSLKARAGPGAGIANDVLEKDAARQAEKAGSKFSITAPNGKTYSFPDAKSLANFKLTTGIR